MDQSDQTSFLLSLKGHLNSSHFFLPISCVPYEHPHFLSPHLSFFPLGNHSVLCNYFIFLCFSLSYSPFIHPFFLLCLYNYLKNHLFRYELVTGGEHLKSRNNETEKLLISHGEKSQKYILSFSDTKPCQYLF